jgi:uncharacterized protein
MKRDKEYSVIPFASKNIGKKILVSNRLGNWSLLNSREFKEFNSLNLKSINSGFLKRLYDEGLIVDKENFTRLVNEFRSLNRHLSLGPVLQIAVVTNHCNLACRYCQTKTDKKQNMDISTADKLLSFIARIESRSVNLEFQGGEPLLNWPVIDFFIKNVAKLQGPDRQVKLSLVTNGTLLDKEKIDFLTDKGVSICVSLDGPQAVHDKNRFFPCGKGSYKEVAKNLKLLKGIYKQKKVNRSIDLLPTITKDSLSFYKEIIDEYISWGANIIPLRPLTRLGLAQDAWRNIGYTPAEFNRFWQKSMDYILEQNKKGVFLSERLAWVFLKKILKKEDSGYVDLTSPCGAGRNVLAYMPDGDIFPCDEARMTGQDMFKLGNLNKTKDYADIVKSSPLFSLLSSSVMDLWSYNSVFSPWIGTCPVVNYTQQNNLVPKITDTPLYKIYSFQLEYIFKKISESKVYKDIFLKWVKDS